MSAETITEIPKVFDVSLYKDLDPEIRKAAIIEDLAGLVLEAGATSLEDRINPRMFRVANGEVYDPRTGNKVPGNLNYSSELSRRESEAANKFYNFLKSSVNLAGWISPAGGVSPYKEDRFVFAHRKGNTIEYYPIPSHLSPEECVDRALALGNFSKEIINLSVPDDLRNIAIPINLPEDIDPWDFLSRIVHLDSNAWQAIMEGRPWKLKALARKHATEIYRKNYKKIESARSEYDFVSAGASMENGMQNYGWTFNDTTCPGSFNSHLINTILGNAFVKDGFGNLRLTENVRKLKCECGLCGEKVVALIYGGHIHCPACNGSKPYKC